MTNKWFILNVTVRKLYYSMNKEVQELFEENLFRPVLT